MKIRLTWNRSKKMEKQNIDFTHINVKDDQGNDFLCPAESPVGTKNTDLDLNVCFERDIPGRYAAMIKIRES